MYKPTPTALAVALSFCAVPASPPAFAASDADLAEIRRQLQQMRDAYEQRIVNLEQKLAKAEGVAAKAEETAREAESSARQANLRSPAAPATAPANAFNPEVSLILQGQYRKMKDVEHRQISGFWPGTTHDHGDDHGAGERGFSIDHTELVLEASIDPFWRGKAVLAMADGEVETEEAWFQSLGLGYGLGLKGGRIRSGIGYLNEQHAHAWDFSDAPLMYTVMFGEHASYAADGVQLKWVAPTPFFLEFGSEVGRGANFPGTDRNGNGIGDGTFFVHVGDDVGSSHSWRAGLSYLQTKAKNRSSGDGFFTASDGADAVGIFDGKSKTMIADFVWKWAPDGNSKYRSFKLQGEYFQRREKGTLDCQDDAGAACNGGAGVVSDYRTRQSGGYLQGVYQFSSNWRAGLRYDRLDSGSRHFGANDANIVNSSFTPKRLTVMADYSWSEFSRMRLQFAQDKSMQGVTDNQVWLQYIMSLGAHGAHRF